MVEDKGIKLYRVINLKKQIILLVSCLAVILMGITDLLVGSSNLTFQGVVRTLIEGPLNSGNHSIIVWSIRLPMTVTSIGVGSCLALAGLQIQTITNNFLASPYTLGISSGASFGASIAIISGFSLLGYQWLGTTGLALVVAMLATFLIFLFGRFKGLSSHTLVLMGIVMNFFFTALQQLIQHIANPEIATIISSWTFGNLSRANWLSALITIFLALVILTLFLKYSWQLTTFTVGEEKAISLGIPVQKFKFVIFLLSSLLVAGGVSFIGTVGFVGLVAPHCARLLVGEDQRYLIPLTTSFGGLMMLIASVVSKMISPGSMIPVGIITSLVGVPFLFILLLKEK